MYRPDYSRGVFNRYRKGMPLFERLVKDCIHLVKWFKIASGKDPMKRMLIYPHYPSKAGTIYKIASHMGYVFTNKPQGQFDFVVFWEYATYRQAWPFDHDFGSGRPIINAESVDISKDVLDQKMTEAFGYGLNINPKEAQTPYVKKSVVNALHDGKVFNESCDPEDGFVYQKLIDSRVNDHEVMDLRVVVIGKQIPHLYKVYRAIDDRFVGTAPKAVLQVNVDEELSKPEQENLISLARIMHLDYTEFDVLRDAGDKKIYVVDANNTSHGPPPKLTKAEKSLALDNLCQAFRKEFKA